jgi:hypothetical protein
MTTRFTAARGRMLAAGTSLLVLTIACAKKDATTDTSAAATTTSSTTASTSAPTTSSAMTQKQQRDMHDAVHGYRLTESNVDKVISATRKMRALEKSNPQLVAAMQREHGAAGDAKSIDEAAARLDAIPPAKAILSSVGISSRDYLLTMFTLMESAAAYQFQKAGKLPPNSDLAKDVTPENLAYIGAHQAQLQTLEKANDSGGDE